MKSNNSRNSKFINMIVQKNNVVNTITCTTSRTISKLGEPFKTKTKTDIYFRWSKIAEKTKERYHQTKNGITVSIKLPLQNKPKLDKKSLLESRTFSKYHYDLINNAYSKENRALKIAIETAKHEQQIAKMQEKLNAYKSSLKLRNPKNMSYRIVSYYEDDKQHIRILSEKFVNDITTNIINKEMKELNMSLSKYDNYHHISLKDKDDKVLALYTKIPYTLGFVA